MTYLGKGNFNRRGFGASLGAVKVKLFFLVMMGAALGSVQAQGGGEGQEEEEGPVLPVVPVLNQVIPDQELRAEDGIQIVRRANGLSVRGRILITWTIKMEGSRSLVE